jgi:hypothetical protein
MKKLVFFLVLVAGMFFAAGNLQAQGNADNQNQKETTQTVRPGFVDNNGDGICDNYYGTRPGKGLGPGNGNGRGRHQGKGLRRCGRKPGRGGQGYFIDANKNGICDNLENGTGRQRLQDGSGRANSQKGK